MGFSYLFEFKIMENNAQLKVNINEKYLKNYFC